MQQLTSSDYYKILQNNLIKLIQRQKSETVEKQENLHAVNEMAIFEVEDEVVLSTGEQMISYIQDDLNLWIWKYIIH